MQFGLGWKPESESCRDVDYIASSVKETRPIDLRPGLPPVYDQGSLNTAVANAVAAALTYSQKNNVTPSRLFIYYFARSVVNQETSSDNGAEIRAALESLVKFGAPEEEFWPYDAKQVAIRPSKEAIEHATLYPNLSFRTVKQNLPDILGCLTNNGPVIFGTQIFSGMTSVECLENGFVPMPNEGEEAVGRHCMLIVGWQPDSQHFIVRNSWGITGGNQSGHFAMPIDYVLNQEWTRDLWTIVAEA